MRHATAFLYHVCAVASRNIRFVSCGTNGKLTLWTRCVYCGVVHDLGSTARTSRVQENQLSVYEETKFSGVQEESEGWEKNGKLSLKE
jgi:hypothetical protein